MKFVDMCLLDEVYSTIIGKRSLCVLDFGDANEAYKNALRSTLALHDAIDEGKSLNHVRECLRVKSSECAKFTLLTGIDWPI